MTQSANGESGSGVLSISKSVPIPIGTTLQHYKGGHYTVVGSCVIEASLKLGVLYKPLQGDMQHVVWMRPLAEFGDIVPVADERVPRFVVISDATS